MIYLSEYQYWAIRRNRTNCKLRYTVFSLEGFCNIDAGYCLDNAAVCFRDET